MFGSISRFSCITINCSAKLRYKTYVITYDLCYKTYDMQDVDDIHEYLLLKGVDAVSIHGGKEQEERNEAIKLFKVCVSFVLLPTLSTGRKTPFRSSLLPNHGA